MSDSQWPPHDPGGGLSPWGQEPTSYHQPPPPHPVYVRGPSLLPVALVVLAVVLVLAAGAVAAVLLTGDDDDPEPAAAAPTTVAATPTTPTTTPQPQPQPQPDPQPQPAADTTDVLSPDGFTALVAAVRERTGGTVVFEAVVYPGYAVVSVPVDASSLREESLRWDGQALSDFGGKGTSTDERVDLADVDPAVLRRLVGRAERLVEDADTTYVIVRGRSTVFDDDGARVMAYASNEFSETAYVAADLDGTVLRTYDG